MNITNLLWARTGSRVAVECDSLGFDRFKAIEVVDVPSGHVVGRAPGDLDGVSIYAFRGDGEAVILDVLGKLSQLEFRASTTIPIPGFPDRDISAKGGVSPGLRLAVKWLDSKQLAITQLESGAVLTRLDHPFKERPDFAWSDDGGTAVTTDDQQTIEVWETATGKRRRVLSAPPHQSYGGAKLSADGSKLFYAQAPKGPSIEAEVLSRVSGVDVATGKASRAWTTGDYAISPDGLTLFLSSPGRVQRVDIAAGKIVVLSSWVVDPTEFRTQSFLGLTLSPDGRWLTGIRPYVGGNTLLAVDAATGERARWAGLP
jgi:hypothetical protein